MNGSPRGRIDLTIRPTVETFLCRGNGPGRNHGSAGGGEYNAEPHSDAPPNAISRKRESRAYPARNRRANLHPGWIVQTTHHRRLSAVSLETLETIGRNVPIAVIFPALCGFWREQTLNMTENSLSPKLLVSIRSVGEALAAIQGGCEILDIKEPRNGSLGAADPGTIAVICEAVAKSERPLPVSVALGELTEWPDDRPVLSLPGNVAFAKLGLSRCRDRPDWQSRWADLRERFNATAAGELSWIAVLYADAVAASPNPESLISAAAQTGCRGVLVDTFSKQQGRLFDHVTRQQLTFWRDAAHASGLLFAIAGSLRESDLPTLKDIAPDIIAVRGAVCRGTNRTAEIDEGAVLTFHQRLTATNEKRTPDVGYRV